MIVIAIIGILAAVAVPQYGQYTKRAKYSEIISYTSAYKTDVASCVQDKNDLTNCNHNENGIKDEITSTTGNIASLTIVSGTITTTGTEAVDHAVYKLVPNYKKSTSELTWSVDHADPNSCFKYNYCK